MNFWLAANRPPLIIAHRGSSAAAPENTLAAFKQAIRDRADAIELDVQLTSDGEVVVFHDRRLERTTDGKGFLRNHSLQELRRLSAGRWFSTKFSSEKIPTLQEVFDLIQGTIGINIEIKAERRFHSSYDLADRCCKLITAHNLQHRVLVSSFSRSVITRVKELKPSIPTGLLYYPFSGGRLSPVRLAKSVKADYLIVGGTALRKNLVEKAVSQGIHVGEFTVNTSWRIHRAVRYNVGAIITNHPVAVRKALKK